jgi:hypothetical protein
MIYRNCGGNRVPPPDFCKVFKIIWLMVLYRVKYSIDAGCG